MKKIGSKISVLFSGTALLFSLIFTPIASAYAPLVVVFITGAAMVGGVAVGFGILSKSKIHAYDNVSWTYLEHLRLAIYDTETGRYSKTDDRELLLPMNASAMENLEAYKEKLPQAEKAKLDAVKGQAGLAAYYVNLGKYVLNNNAKWPNYEPRRVSAGDAVAAWDFESVYALSITRTEKVELNKAQQQYEAKLAAYVEKEKAESKVVAEWRAKNIITEKPAVNTKP